MLNPWHCFCSLLQVLVSRLEKANRQLANDTRVGPAKTTFQNPVYFQLRKGRFEIENYLF
jgi:hypothetical protein